MERFQDIVTTAATGALFLLGLSALLILVLVGVDRAAVLLLRNTRAYKAFIAWMWTTRCGKLPWILAPAGSQAAEIAKLQKDLKEANDIIVAQERDKWRRGDHDVMGEEG